MLAQDVEEAARRAVEAAQASYDEALELLRTTRARLESEQAEARLQALAQAQKVVAIIRRDFSAAAKALAEASGTMLRTKAELDAAEAALRLAQAVHAADRRTPVSSAALDEAQLAVERGREALRGAKERLRALDGAS